MRTCNCNPQSPLFSVCGRSFLVKKNPRHPKVLGDRIWDLCTIAYVFTCFLDALRWLISDINLEQEGFDEMETPGDSDGSTRFEGQNPEPHLY